MARIISLSILALIMGLLGITFYRVLSPFLLPLFLAGVIAILGRPLYEYFLKRSGNKPYAAAGLTTSVLVGSVLIPLLAIVTLGALQLYVIAEEGTDHPILRKPLRVLSERNLFLEAASRLDSVLPAEVLQPELDSEGNEIAPTDEEIADHKQQRIQQRSQQFEATFRETVRKLANETFNPSLAFSSLGLLGQLGWIVMAQITFVMALYYFFAEGKQLLEYTEKLIPVDVLHQRELFEQFSKAVRAVVVATMAAAFAQGVATALGLWVLGYGHFFLFTVVATVSALIPMAGTWLVWLPFAIALGYQGDWIWAFGLFLYGFFLVGTLDNIIRTVVLQSDAKLHPLLAFVSVLGGLQVMGLWGVFIAPIVASCLHASVKIFNQELKLMSKAQMPVVPKTEQAPAEETGTSASTKTVEDAPTPETSVAGTASPEQPPASAKQQSPKSENQS